jgi:hypothetical protein
MTNHPGAVRWEAITEEEKQIEREVLAARPPEYRNLRFGKPNYMYNPRQVAAYYKACKTRGITPHSSMIPKDRQAEGGRKGTRKGVPHGHTRKTAEIMNRVAEEALVIRCKEYLAGRMEELESQIPDSIKMSPVLSPEEQAETGLVINPAFYLQKLFLAGDISSKAQFEILRLLMDYTHKKKANTTELKVSRPEEFLEQLAKDDKVIDGQYETVGDSEEAGD